MPGKENDMRKELKAVIAAILALWLFFMGFEIGSYVEKQKISAELGEQQVQPQTVPAAPTTAPTTTTAPASESDAASAPSIGNAVDVITTYPDSELSAATTIPTRPLSRTAAARSANVGFPLSLKHSKTYFA